MPPDAYIAHKIHGRLRIRLPSKRGDGPFFKDLGMSLSGCPGVEAVQVSPETASVLLNHTCPQGAIEHFVRERGLFELRNPSAPGPTFMEKIKADIRSVDDRIKGGSGDAINLAGVSFLSLVGMGFYEILAGNFVALPWYASFWYAFSILTLNRDNPQ